MLSSTLCYYRSTPPVGLLFFALHHQKLSYSTLRNTGTVLSKRDTRKSLATPAGTNLHTVQKLVR